MASIGQLYARFRQLIHEGFKFLVIGGIGAVVTFGVANVLHSIGPYKAITVATILATVVTYLGNRYWTFTHRQSQGTTRDTGVFFVLNAVGLVIYYACIGLVHLAGLVHDVAWYNVALVVGTGLGTLFRFWSYRKWIWKEKQHPAAGHEALPGPDSAHEPEPAAMAAAIPAAERSASGYHAQYGRPGGQYGYDDPVYSDGEPAPVPGAPASGPAAGRSGSHRQPRHARPSGVPAAEPAESAGHAPASHRRTD